MAECLHSGHLTGMDKPERVRGEFKKILRVWMSVSESFLIELINEKEKLSISSVQLSNIEMYFLLKYHEYHVMTYISLKYVKLNMVVFNKMGRLYKHLLGPAFGCSPWLPG